MRKRLKKVASQGMETAVNTHRRKRNPKRQITETTAAAVPPNDAVPRPSALGLNCNAEANGGWKSGDDQNAVGDDQQDAVLPCVLPQQEIYQVPQGRRSKRKIRHEQITVIHGFAEGASQECPKESRGVASKLARKRRKTKRIADEKDSEVTVPRHFHCRGQSRRINRNNAESRAHGMLDSKTFDCYLENMWRDFPEEKRSLFTCLDSLWFSLYSNKHYKSKVLDWVKKKDIFAKKYVIVPIVKWSHWSLLIMCHFGESGQSDSQTRCMLLLDSLQETNPKRLEPGIRRFIMDICLTEERSEGKEQVKKIPLLIPKVPQQRDNKECGNFVLYYINLFIQNAPENFNISEGYPYFMTEDWFTRQGLESFYERLDSIPKNLSTKDLLEASDSNASCASDVDIIELTEFQYHTK